MATRTSLGRAMTRMCAKSSSQLLLPLLAVCKFAPSFSPLKRSPCRRQPSLSSSFVHLSGAAAQHDLSQAINEPEAQTVFAAHRCVPLVHALFPSPPCSSLDPNFLISSIFFIILKFNTTFFPLTIRSQASARAGRRGGRPGPRREEAWRERRREMEMEGGRCAPGAREGAVALHGAGLPQVRRPQVESRNPGRGLITSSCCWAESDTEGVVKLCGACAEGLEQAREARALEQAREARALIACIFFLHFFALQGWASATLFWLVCMMVVRGLAEWQDDRGTSLGSWFNGIVTANPLCPLSFLSVLLISLAPSSRPSLPSLLSFLLGSVT
jgi:hypothetical protein